MTRRSAATRIRPTAPRRLELQYLDLRISVYSPTPAHLDWLAEFLSPAFTLDPGGRRAVAAGTAGGADDDAHCAVTLTEDDEAFQRWRDHGPEPDASPIDCFALDSRVIRLRRWRALGEGTAAYDEEYQVFYRVAESERTVELVSANGNAHVRTPLMRVVRELAMNRCAIRSQFVLHAAAARAGDRAIVIAGKTNAGKTTLLTYLLAHTALRYLANDRVVVDLSGDPGLVRGMPSVVTLRRGTLARFPQLRQQLRVRGYDLRLTPDEVAHRPAAPRRFRDGRYGLSPRQFCALLGTQPVPDARAGLLVLPQLTGTSASFRLRSIAPATVARRLPTMLLHAGSWLKSSDLFRFPDDPATHAEPLKGLCRTLAETVRAVRLEIGTRAYRSPALAEALLAEVGEPGLTLRNRAVRR